METLNYKVLESTGYNGYILKDAPVKVMQFGEGNFLRAFVDYFFDIANEKAGYNGKVKLVQPIANFPRWLTGSTSRRVCTPCTCAAARRARRSMQSASSPVCMTASAPTRGQVGRSAGSGPL